MNTLPIPTTVVQPAEDSLADLNIEPEDIADFHLVLRILTRQLTERVSIKRACQLEGLARSSFYEPRYQELLRKANIYISRPMAQTIRAVNHAIVENWPDLVNEAIRIGLSSGDDQTRLKAIELLYNIGVAPFRTEEKDDLPEQNYLKQVGGGISFNPLQPILAIQAQPGSVVNVNQPGAEPTEPSPST